MSEKPFIKFYASDFLAGTSGLSPAERGVYITLLCLIWDGDGPIEMDEGRLARRCGAPKSTFRKVLDALLAEGKIVRTAQGLTNDRAEKSLSDRQNRIENASHAARERWGALDKKTEQKQQPKNAEAMRKDMPAQCVDDASQSQSQNIGGGGDARTNATHQPRVVDREKILHAMGLDRSGVTANGRIVAKFADMQEAERWHGDLGLDTPTIYALVAEAMAEKNRGPDPGPPATFRYFTPIMQRAAASASRPNLTPIEGGRSHVSARPATDRRSEALRGMAESVRDVIAAQQGGCSGPDDRD